MQQTWHIFKKDARYLRREITLLLALAAIFTWLGAGGSLADAISDAMEPVFIAAAGFTIARLIHAEAIPGENQFWVTRPYQWQSLLGAKILFVLAFMNLPVLLAQAIILIVNGFSLGSIVPGLLWVQVLFLVCIEFPLVVLATVTDSMVQFVGSPLATAFLVFVVLYLERDIHWRVIMTPNGIEWLRDAILFVTLLAIAVPALYWQYRYRRTQTTRIFSIGITVCGAVLYLSIPWDALFATQSLLTGRNSDTAPLRIEQAGQIEIRRARLSGWRRFGQAYSFSVPLQVTGLPPNAFAQYEGISVDLKTAEGQKTSIEASRMRIDHSKLLGEIYLPPSTAARPLTLRAAIYLTVFGNVQEQNIMLSPRPQNVIGSVQCYNAAFNQLECRAPFRWPGLLVSQANPGDARNLLTGLISYSPFPADLQLDPMVRKSPVYYTSKTAPPERPVTIQTQEPIAFLRRDLEVRDLRLP